MFLIERLIGVSLYALLLIVICFLISFSRIRLKRIFIFYLIILSVMGYVYKPYITADLYRIFDSLDLFKLFNFSDFCDRFVYNSSIPVARIFYWSIAKTGQYSLLPLISSLINYSCCFYIIYRTSRIYRISRNNVAIALLFFMSIGHYISVISNVRTMIAISMICYCFFRESIEKKFSWYHAIMYVFAVFIHNLAIVLLVLRLISSIIGSENLWQRLTFTIMMFCGIGIMIFYGDSFLSELTEKAEDYLSGGYSYVWEYIIGSIILVFSLLILIKRIRIARSDLNTNQKLSLKEYDVCLIASLIVTIMFVTVFTFFYRFLSGVVPILILPSLMITLQNYDSTEISALTYKRISVGTLTLVYSVIILILTCTRGSMCSYKFFEL